MRQIKNIKFLLLPLLLISVTLACQLTNGITQSEKIDAPTVQPSEAPATVPASETDAKPTFTPLPVIPTPTGESTLDEQVFVIDERSLDEPVFVIGEIPYTSPFFLNSASEPFIMLEDQAGFILRDLEHQFNLEGQAIGPVEIDEDLSLSYGLALPAVPQGTSFDLDNDAEQDPGVQVFAVAYWSNTWGGPFLEKRDGTGWSNAYVSTITDPDNDNEIIGGTLIVWSPDDKQGFPEGFGEDGLLFTEDDPVIEIQAGYNLVDLNQEPFRIYKESHPTIDMIEGEVAVNDFSEMSYTEAFDALFEKASREYPFTELKGIDWQDLYDQYAPRIESASNPEEFYTALRDFTYDIPDGHVGLSFNPDVFFSEQGGSFGLVLTELSDGRLIVKEVLPGTPGEQEGILTGAEIITWDGKPVQDALTDVVPYLGPYSTEHTRRVNQAVFLTRVAPGDQVEITYRNPDSTQIERVELISTIEYNSLFRSIQGFYEDEMALPIQAEVLDDSSLGYLRVITFSDDYHLMAQLWERHIQALIDSDIQGLIIDLRSNSGGSSGLAYDFAGYFIDEEILLYTGSYYNDQTGQFESEDYPARIEPAPLFYEGPIAVLVGPDCVSACEGFAHALTQTGRAIVVGHYPSAGAFGEVGRGQYDMPDDLSMQFPTGRPIGPDGDILIEGVGIIPDILVPVTEESALGIEDTVLSAAIEALLDLIR